MLAKLKYHRNLYGYCNGRITAWNINNCFLPCIILNCNSRAACQYALFIERALNRNVPFLFTVSESGFNRVTHAEWQKPEAETLWLPLPLTRASVHEKCVERVHVSESFPCCRVLRIRTDSATWFAIILCHGVIANTFKISVISDQIKKDNSKEEEEEEKMLNRRLGKKLPHFVH